jgi:ADP-dependent NAD(P)H-hydrate dehydratase / NAD(P)H-hydrate epimerase
MKIFSSSQIREADKFTIQHEPVSSADLMERAAVVCTDWIIERCGTRHTFSIFCGTGNNGGDGLAIARMLFLKGCSVEVYILDYSDKQSEDFGVNYNRLQALVPGSQKIIRVKRIEQISLSPDNIIIDAILGTGISRPLEGILKETVHLINTLSLKVISIDIPSGLFCDKLNGTEDIIVKADYTLTFQFPKLSFMFIENQQFTGLFSILDIGISKEYIEKTGSRNIFITKEEVAPLLRKRSRIAHKGNFGHALLVCGSYGKVGAAILSARACMRVGAGLLTVRIPACGYNILQTAVPEAMADADEEEKKISGTIKAEKYNAIGAGPGLGTENETQNALKLLIQNTQVPMVFDADALNILAENKTWLSFIPPGSVLTPHVAEFGRLTEKGRNSEERHKLQKEFALKYSCYLILKGAHTSVCFPDGTMYFNSTGNPGMATGGSGDVLTGMIVGLLAQGYTSGFAAIAGVYLHGLAGDIAADRFTEECMTASDIIEAIPDAYKYLSA